jgi:hypothetical protein
MKIKEQAKQIYSLCFWMHIFCYAPRHISKCLTKGMYEEKSKRQVIWDRVAEKSSFKLCMLQKPVVIAIYIFFFWITKVGQHNKMGKNLTVPPNPRKNIPNLPTPTLLQIQISMHVSIKPTISTWNSWLRSFKSALWETGKHAALGDLNIVAGCKK